MATLFDKFINYCLYLWCDLKSNKSYLIRKHNYFTSYLI